MTLGFENWFCASCHKVSCDDDNVLCIHVCLHRERRRRCSDETKEEVESWRVEVVQHLDVQGDKASRCPEEFFFHDLQVSKLCMTCFLFAINVYQTIWCIISSAWYKGFLPGMHAPPRPRGKWLPRAAPAPKIFNSAPPRPAPPRKKRALPRPAPPRKLPRGKNRGKCSYIIKSFWESKTFDQYF